MNKASERASERGRYHAAARDRVLRKGAPLLPCNVQRAWRGRRRGGGEGFASARSRKKYRSPRTGRTFPLFVITARQARLALALRENESRRRGREILWLPGVCRSVSLEKLTRPHPHRLRVLSPCSRSFRLLESRYHRQCRNNVRTGKMTRFSPLIKCSFSASR